MTSSEKQPQPAPAEQPKEQLSDPKAWRVISPEEARALGIPARNDLIISPVPRKKD
jgi:hypothetical protein